jgi:hypothetical protein
VTRRWETALLALCFTVAGLVALAIAFGGTATYGSIMRAYAPATFHLLPAFGPPRDALIDLPVLIGYHDSWFAYVTGDAPSPPIFFGGVAVFTSSEYAHMEDVRGLFVGARVLAIVAAALAAVLVLRAGRRSPVAAVLLIRDSAVGAGLGVAVLAGAAAVSFDALFLLFHEVLFPQGNFLFGPDSNLIAMYPDPYWYGVTLRVGLTFVAGIALIAIAAAATLRQGRR